MTTDKTMTTEEKSSAVCRNFSEEESMYYTIASTRDHDGMEYICFNANGNKYDVEYTNKGRQEITRKTFASIYAALDVYEKFVEAFILGNYSYEDRKSWMEGRNDGV